MSKTPKLRFPEFSGEWEETTLGNVSLKLDYGMGAAAKEYDGKNKYIRITDIDEETNKYNNKNIVSPEGELDSYYLVKEDDLLISRTGASTGKSYIYDINDGILYFAGFLIRARISKQYNSKFVFLQTMTSKYNRWVKIMSMRSGQPGINAKEYSEYKFYIPSLQEQQKIASFLSLVDKKIEKQSEKVEAIKEYKKGMMQKIFSREIRFKDDEGKEFPEWENRKLYEIVERITRKNKGILSNLPLTISAQYGLVDQEKFFNKTVASSNLEGYYLLYNGEFAYNKSYSNGYPYGAIKRLDKYDMGVVSNLYICFKPKNEVSSEYILQYFETDNWHKEVSMIAVEGARNHGLLNISVTDFFETIHLIPSIKEQQKIANFLSTIDKKLEKEEEKLEALKTWKKGLLQQMFV